MFEPVPADEMAFAMSLFVSLAKGNVRPAELQPDLRSSQESQQCWQLFRSLTAGDPFKPDGSLFRAFSALWNHYHLDQAQRSVAARVLGFHQLMERTRGSLLERWSKAVPGAPETIVLHPAVIEAIAKAPLTPEGALGPDVLLRTIEITAVAYPDLLNANAASQSPAENPGSPWPAGTGEIAGLMRSMDWSQSTLGEPATWPQSLRTSVNIILACRFPMIVLWGQELSQFYNDAYREVMGDKHPCGLGQATRECWPEVWEFNQPIYDQVLRGASVTFEDQLFPINRYGFLEDAYFTLCYSPIRNELSIEGVLVSVFETTDSVLLRRGMSRKRSAPEGGDPESMAESSIVALQAPDTRVPLFWPRSIPD